MKMKSYQTAVASPKGGSKKARPEPSVGNNGQATKAADLKATKSPPKASEPVEPDEGASDAVAALIRSGDDARSLFEALRRFAAGWDEALEALTELGTLLDAWESHLPPGHRSGDAPFWSDVAAVCGDVSEVFRDLPCSIDFGIARVLFEAIEKAALAHLNDARTSTDD